MPAGIALAFAIGYFVTKSQLKSVEAEHTKSREDVARLEAELQAAKEKCLIMQQSEEKMQSMREEIELILKSYLQQNENSLKSDNERINPTLTAESEG